MATQVNPNPSTIVPGQDQSARYTKSKSVEDAQAKAKDATEKAKKADDAAHEARMSVFSKEQRAAMDARSEADKADAEAKQAALEVQQAKANAVLEHKIGRKLKAEEFARWISGDHSNMREENLELASPAIMALEAKTGHHVNAEEMLEYEMDYEHSSAARALKEKENRAKGE